MTLKILGNSSVLPQKVLTNFDLEKMVDTSDEWITKMTGIKERHVLSGDETYLSCALQAAQQALVDAEREPESMDMIILGTSTPWQVVPSTAGILQGALGIKNCFAFDLQAACSGFVYASYVACQIMRADPTKRHALVMGCDALSKITDWEDRRTCVLFGDGFGAMVIGQTEENSTSRIIDCDIGSDGKGRQDLEVPWGVAKDYNRLRELGGCLAMNGREVYKNSVYYFVQLINSVLEKHGISHDEIDWIIPHQANLRIIEAVGERTRIPKEKFVVTLDKHGNTSSASIPLAYHFMKSQGKIKKNDLVLFVGFGAGYTWGTMLFKV